MGVLLEHSKLVPLFNVLGLETKMEIGSFHTASCELGMSMGMNKSGEAPTVMSFFVLILHSLCCESAIFTLITFCGQ